jgi:hypothetical protein
MELMIQGQAKARERFKARKEAGLLTAEEKRWEANRERMELKRVLAKENYDRIMKHPLST